MAGMAPNNVICATSYFGTHNITLYASSKCSGKSKQSLPYMPRFRPFLPGFRRCCKRHCSNRALHSELGRGNEGLCPAKANKS